MARKLKTQKISRFGKRKLFIIAFALVLFICTGILIIYRVNFFTSENTKTTQTVALKSIDSTIIADGIVTAQNQATLHFQTGGKVVFLPFQEGDPVRQGQTIAQLDTYALQRQLTQTLNTYRYTRDTFDQTQQNVQDNVLQAQQSSSFTSAQMDKSNAINDVVKRILDQNQANLDNSVINVELANYALQLSTLTSPINGILTHEDTTVSGQNITQLTSFIVADPESKIFRGNILANYISYITTGMSAEITLDGESNKLHGIIVKIFPSKINLPNGENVYQVDIQSDELKALAKLDQAGTAEIMTNAENIMLIPAWTVLGDKYVWINNDGNPQLKTITVGKKHDGEIEVNGGLSRQDKVITDPKSIPAQKYRML